MRVLFCGDIVGKSGRKLVASCLPKLKKQLCLDMVIVNGENAAHGFGITPRIYDELIRNGVHVITLGNHSFDKPDIFPVLDSAQNIIRPLNYPENTIGKGWCFHTTEKGIRVAVVQLLGHTFMRAVADPFECIEKWIKTYNRTEHYDILIVDFHAEATAEKVALGHFLDGYAGLVAGTHTHIPTADAHILNGGTAYISDIGMCGDYDSVIGMKKEGALIRFLTPDKKGRLQPAEAEGTFCAVCADIDEKTGLATQIFPVRIGAALENTHQI